jgi:hypothetical protein
MATAKASKPYHYIRVSRKMFDDLNGLEIVSGKHYWGVLYSAINKLLKQSVTFLKMSCPLKYLNYAIPLAIENNTICP